MPLSSGNDRTPRTRPRRNPFHPVLLAAGAAFFMAACSYTVLYIKQWSAGTEASRIVIEQHPWLALVDRYGETLLATTLAILTVAVLADVLWEHRRSRNVGTTAVSVPDRIQEDRGDSCS